MPDVDRALYRRYKRVRRPGAHFLSRLDHLLILRSQLDGLAYEATARRIPCHWVTVETYWSKVRESPELVFEHPEAYTQKGKAKFECGFCGTVREKEEDIMRHVIAHFCAPEVAKNYDLTKITERRL